MERIMNFRNYASVFGTLLFLLSPAKAAITSVSPTGGSTGLLILNNPCTNEVDSGSIVTGCLNKDHNSEVNFTSNEPLVFLGGGQARVDAQDGLTQTETIDPVSFDLSRMILNLDASKDGWVQFCDNNGCFGNLLALDGNGQNFFDIHFAPSADFLTLNTFSDSNGTSPAQLIADTQQWRVQLAQPVNQVPEPASWMLVAPFALIGMWFLRRRRAALVGATGIEPPPV
jgi:hypothetical protein